MNAQLTFMYPDMEEGKVLNIHRFTLIPFCYKMYSFITENGNCNFCGATAIFSCKTCGNLCHSCQNACVYNDHDKSRHIVKVINYTYFCV